MKLKLCLVGVIVLILGAVVVASVSAQGALTPTPEQIAIAGRRGAVETRTLLLQATGPVTDLQIIPLDLHRTDGETVLPASAIRVDLPSDGIEADGLLTVPVTVDLHDVSSGKFSGSLLISYHGGTLSLPVSVTVKDYWLPPLLVLLVGVGVGVGVSVYRARGRPRDEVLKRVGQLRAQMRGDGKLAEPFLARIEAHLVDVEAMLQAESWEGAEQAAGKAEAVWTLWRKGRDDWLVQLAYHAELVQKLQDEPNVPYFQTLWRNLEDALRGAPDMEGPHKLRERLDELARQINRYDRLQGRLDDLGELCIRLPADQVGQWRLKIQAFQRRLYDLGLNDKQAYETLQEEVEQALDELIQEVPRQRGVIKAALELETRGLGARVLQLLAPPPSAREISTEEASEAGFRLRLFTWASYVIALAMLVGAGFGELYVANETFGANAWGDYFALLAWGFGAEATRAAIADMVRGWGLPGLE
jgi:hypothetical protein